MITGRMDTTTTKNDFKLLEIVDTGRRRRFSAEAKRQIVQESFVSGDAVSAVARRHGLFPAQLFAWRRAAREGAFGIWNGAIPAWSKRVSCLRPILMPSIRLLRHACQ